MCGRITQTREIREYARAVGWGDEDFRRHDIGGYTATYNGPPGVKHLVLRQYAGHRVVEMVHWGYTSRWAKEKGFAQAINAKREKLLGSYYRALMQTGRIIVPAEGWYEWTGPKGQRQPWYVRAKNGEPLFLAGLTNHFPDRDDPEGAGFVLVTNDVAGGMIDIHDRRPVALTAEDARLWMDPTKSVEEAEHIVRTFALPEDYFEWYRVSPAASSVKNDTPDLVVQDLREVVLIQERERADRCHVICTWQTVPPSTATNGSETSTSRRSRHPERQRPAKH